MSAVLEASDATASLRLQIEVQPVGTPFAGHATSQSSPVSSGARAYALASGLSPVEVDLVDGQGHTLTTFTGTVDPGHRAGLESGRGRARGNDERERGRGRRDVCRLAHHVGGHRVPARGVV